MIFVVAGVPTHLLFFKVGGIFQLEENDEYYLG